MTEPHSPSACSETRLYSGTKHDSAHVGDEHSERTGRQRIGYTREELVAGVSWRPARKWRIYAEGGFGYGLDDFQDPGRLLPRRRQRRVAEGSLVKRAHRSPAGGGETQAAKRCK